MKKYYMLLVINFIFLLLTACGTKENKTVENVAPTYDTCIKVACEGNLILDKYDVDVYIDEDKIDTLQHGKDNTYNIQLTEGEHSICFTKESDKDVQNSATITVKKTKNEFEFKIKCHSSTIDLEECQLKEDEEKTKKTSEDESSSKQAKSISFTNSSSDYHGRPYQEVLSELTDLGFTNIETADVYGDGNPGEVTDVYTLDGSDLVAIEKGKSFPADTLIYLYYVKEDDVNNSEKAEATNDKEDNNKLAYVKRCQDYNIYYVIDLKNKTALYGTSDDATAATGVFTNGDNLNDGIDVTFYQGTENEYTDRVHWHYRDADSTLILIDPNGFEWEYKKTDMSLVPDTFK